METFLQTKKTKFFKSKPLCRLIKPVQNYDEVQNILFSIFISALSLVEARELPNSSDLAEDASPAVVNITSTRTVSQRNSYGRGFETLDMMNFSKDFLDNSQDLLFLEKILDQ